MTGKWIPQHSHRFYLLVLVLAGNGAMSRLSHAIASEDDTITPYVETDMLYDSNLLRASKNVSPNLLKGKTDKSEIINQLMAGFDLDWKISNQHITAKANVNQNWYQNFTQLDYLGWNTQVQWNWQLGSHFSGEIGYGNIETLGNFTYINSLQPNLQNNQRYFANGGWLFHPNGKVKIGIYRNQLDYDDPSRKFNSNIEDTGEFNLLYLSPKGNSVGFQLLATDGKYPNLQFKGGTSLDNAYTRFIYGGTWDWHITSKSGFSGFLGFTEQTYENVKARNFDGFIGRLNFSWQPREYLRVDFAAMREIHQAQNLLTSFLLAQGVENIVTWQATSKIKLKLVASYQNQVYLGDVGASKIGTAREQDNVGNIGLNLSYNPVTYITLAPVFNFEKRESNDPSRVYESLSAGINVKAAF